MLFYFEIVLATMIAATLETVVGFGGGLLLLPVLVLLVGSKDAVLLSALIPLGWNIPRLFLLRGSVNWRTAGLFALGIVPGAVLGALYLEITDPRILQTGIGISVVLFGLYYIARLYIDLPEPHGLKNWSLPIIGLISGIISSLLGAGHGPLQAGALVGLGLPVREVAATNGALGAITAVARVIGYAMQGMLYEELWVPAAVAIAAAVAGTFIGFRLIRHSKDSTLELLIGVVLVLAGLRMMM